MCSAFHGLARPTAGSFCDDARPTKDYMMPMQSYLPALLMIGMLATLVVLVVGIVSFAVNGKFYRKNSNNLMRLRVIMQGIALAIFGAIVWLATN